MNLTQQISHFAASYHGVKTFILLLKNITIPVSAWKKRLWGCKGVSFIIWDNLPWSLATGSIFRNQLLELKTFKKQIFTFKILVKPLHFVVKHYIKHIYENCKIFFFLFGIHNFWAYFYIFIHSAIGRCSCFFFACFLKLTIYVLIHIRLCGQWMIKLFSCSRFQETRHFFLAQRSIYLLQFTPFWSSSTHLLRCSSQIV